MALADFEVGTFLVEERSSFGLIQQLKSPPSIGRYEGMLVNLENTN